MVDPNIVEIVCMSGDLDKEKEKDDRLYISWQKSNFFRVIHSDGAWGGLTPKGMLSIAFFSERAPIPRTTSLKIDISPGSNVASASGAERVDDSREGIVREVECQILMSVDSARLLQQWLAEHLQAVDLQKGD